MQIDEAIRRARIMKTLKYSAASMAEQFGRKEEAELNRNDAAALEELIGIAERWKADAD